MGGSGFPARAAQSARRLSLLAGAVLVLAAAPAWADPLVQESHGVVVDWRHGTVTARGVAAADWRMPSADVARAGAERRARSEGRNHLVETLRNLPLGGGRKLDEAGIARAVERARTQHVDYQSNGGVTLELVVGFGDWDEPGATPAATGTAAENPPLALRLGEGSLAAEPRLLIGEAEVALGPVSYAPAGDLAADVRPLTVRADKKGRLVGDAKLDPAELAHRRAVIYVQKIQR